jgi:hypothetical protein
LGLSSIQKYTTSLQMLAYGIAPNAIDECCCLVETITTKCMKRFVKAIHKVFERWYL